MSNKQIFVAMATSFLFGVLFTVLLNNQATKSLIQEKNLLEKKNQTLERMQITTKPLGKQEIYLLADKLQKLDQYHSQKLFFTSRVTKINNDQVTVDIYIEGDKTSLLDAADLRIDFNEGIRILDIKKGQVFSSYPQLSVQGASIVVTGIASLVDRGLEFGKVGERFITISIKKIKPNATLTFMKEGTNIYLMGKSIYDFEKTLSIISF